MAAAVKAIDRVRMLEDSTIQDVVRWSDTGDSFIVLDVTTSCLFFVLTLRRITSSRQKCCPFISNTEILPVSCVS
jgi:hypothetical protein